MATTERWGIKSFDDSGYINLHSDYSSVVYVGEMAQSVTPVRPNYVGSRNIGISPAQKTAYYDMGYLIQYVITNINTTFLVPFYRPSFSGQQIAILDVVKQDSTTWAVNVIYNGTESQMPRLFAFAPLNAMPEPALAANENGLRVYDQAGGLVFTTTKRPLRVDDAIMITHPSAIKTGNRGGCGNDGGGCHINYTSDQARTFTGNITNTSSKLYHIVPSAYGGLAYKNTGDGSDGCGFGRERPYAYAYQSWCSFRGTIGHEFGTAKHTAEWLADFAGAVYQKEEGGCGWGGFLGALLGAVIVVFTGGGALAVIAGALAGFALSGVEGAPGLKGYEADQVFDTNNPSNLIITDATYYGIDISPVQQPLAYFDIDTTLYNVKETTAVVFNVTGFNITNGYYYWTIKHTTTTDADFISTSGYFVISNNAGTFTVTTAQDYTDEPNEYFTVQIRSSSTTGPVLRTTEIITIEANVARTYTLTATRSSIDEGQYATIYVGGTKIINDYYYWTLEHVTTSDADFVNLSGTVEVKDNSGVFYVQAILDHGPVGIVEGPQTFKVVLRSNSITGEILGTSAAITINDTSKWGGIVIPSCTIYPSTEVILEGETVTFTVVGYGMSNGQYGYDISTLYTDASDFVEPIFGWFTMSNNSGTITVTAKQDNATEYYDEPFTVQVRIGQTTYGISRPVTIKRDIA
jgi:hypothetical protein